MISCPRLSPPLLRMNYYISPQGGATRPYSIPENRLVMEWVTVGPVLHPETGEEAEAGTIFLHRENQTTVYRTPPGHHYECMVAEYDLSHAVPVPAWPRSLLWPEEEGGLAFTREMLYSLHRRRMSLEVLGPLIWFQAVYRGEKTRDQTRPVPQRIAASLKRMEQNFSEAFSIETLARQVDLSPSHFHARFREVMGMTPYQFLIQQRMRAARHLLVTTQEPVKAIAFEVGYSNPENFCRAFRKEAGMTAAQFRKANQTFQFD